MTTDFRKVQNIKYRQKLLDQRETITKRDILNVLGVRNTTESN